MNVDMRQEAKKDKVNAARWRRCDFHPTAKAVGFSIALS
jgi:hypothetical protein